MNESHKTVGRLLRSCGALAFAAATVLAAGCGNGKNSVAGKVTLNGAPVKGGVVTLIGAGNEQRVANISPDGEYRVEDAPGGTVKVTVRTLPTNVFMPRTAPAVAKDARLLPPLPPAQQQVLPRKYEGPNNGLTFEVTKGRQTFDIAMTQ